MNREKRGFTLLEMTVVLIVFGILMYALLTVNNPFSTVEKSRTIRARSDLRVLQEAVISFNTDTTFFPKFRDGKMTKPRDPGFKILMGLGKRPWQFSDPCWTLPPASSNCYLKTSLGGAPMDPENIDFIENQLVRNTPGGNVMKSYPLKETSPTEKGWDGPYVSIESKGFPTDPWGQAYMMIVEFMGTERIYVPLELERRVSGKPAVFAISAGPNGKIETEYGQFAERFMPGGDDIVARFQ